MKRRHPQLFLVFFAYAFCLGAGLFYFLGGRAFAESPPSLTIAPSSGSFTVGSTFSVSVFINTGGYNINTIEANLRYPADKLQVVSPSSGKSVIGIWFAQPTYDNAKGEMRFLGAIPNPGINTSEGLVSQITFRVIGVGTAALRFEDSSRVLLNDGKGTDILGQMTNGLFTLGLPPPAGPIVVSPDHPDQEKWSNIPAASFEWASEENVDGYSYVLSDMPIDVPDDISEGVKNGQVYKNLSDGVHYFHIKSLRNGRWGGVTHYAVKIDTTPPAEFPINVIPAAKTTSRKITLDFTTTDAHSGVDHYEVQIISLSPAQNASGTTKQPFFIEATSPYAVELDLGDYDALVRAYDKAGNYVQATARAYIVDRIFNLVETAGIRVRGDFLLPWMWLWIGAFLVMAFAGWFGVLFRKRHYRIHMQHAMKTLPDEVTKQLAELKRLKEKYKIVAVLLLLSGFFHMSGNTAAAAEQVEFSPPIVTMASRDISNQEIFYIGGKVDTPGGEVIVYVQNLQSGETISQQALADNNGDWFYAHPRFLSTGGYLLWTQTRVGEQLSPPSPQIQMTVTPTALQLGASRLSYAAIYLAVSALQFLIIVFLLLYGYYHYVQGKKKHVRLVADIEKTEESIRRGFAMLRRDIEAELEAVKKAKSMKELSAEEREREERIMRDLERVREYLGREVWEIEQEA